MSFLDQFNKTKQTFTSQFDDFTFGKYKGQALTDIIDDDKSYIGWLIDEGLIEIDPKIRDQVARALGRDLI